MSDNVESNVMPDVESETGDVFIDVSELFEDSDSTSQTDSSSEISKADNSSKVSGTSSVVLQTAGESQIVGETDSGIGYTSGWIN